MDKHTTIQDIKTTISDFVEARGWKPFQKPRNLAISISLEAAELLEIFQWDDKNDLESMKADGSYQHLREELADVLVYCIEMANAMEIDIAECITQKMKKNSVKYPEKIKNEEKS